MLTNDAAQRLAAAQTAFDQGNLATAIPTLQALDQEVDDLLVNQTLARALAADHQYQAAGQVIARHQAAYAQSPALIDLVIEVLLQEQRYLALRQFLHPLTTVTAAQWGRVTAAETAAKQTLATTLANRQRHFLHLGDRGFVEQQRRFQAALRLPLDQFFTAAQFVLRDPAAHPLIKAAILQVLQQVGQTGSVTMEWLDGQTYPLDLAQLQPVDQEPAVQAGLTWLADHYQNNDPQSYQLYVREFLLQMTLLYPRIQETITPVATWMQALTTPTNSGEAPALVAARQWQARLASIVAGLA